MQFLINLIFSTVSFLILLRFMLQCVKANFYHPLVQMLVKITNPILLPVRRITPIIGRWDWSCILLVVIVGLIKYVLLMLVTRIPLSPLIVIGLIFIDILKEILTIYFYAFIGMALCSWFQGSPNAMILMDLIGKLTHPILSHLKFNLIYKRIDFKPLVILFAILLLQGVLNIIYDFIVRI